MSILSRRRSSPCRSEEARARCRTEKEAGEKREVGKPGPESWM